MWAYDTPSAVVQLLLNILAVVCGFSVHLNIAIRTIVNCEKMSQHRKYVVALSAVNIIDLLVDRLLNEVGSSFSCPVSIVL